MQKRCAGIREIQWLNRQTVENEGKFADALLRELATEHSRRPPVSTIVCVPDRLRQRPLTSVTAAGTPAKAQAGAECEGKAGIADGRDVLVVEKILSLRVDIEPGEPLVAAAEVEFGVAVVEVSIGQQQAVAAGSIVTFKVG
jgi:hypothetical protein